MLEPITHPQFWNLFQDDPVRPHLSPEFRTHPGRVAFRFVENDITRAVICCARCSTVPATEAELESTTDPQGTVAVFYTVWSYDRGAGRDTVFAARQWAESVGCTRYVTLSPLTEMAERFHTANGARCIARHSTAQNFEYD